MRGGGDPVIEREEVVSGFGRKLDQALFHERSRTFAA
jgi:hypothetical protein